MRKSCYREYVVISERFGLGGEEEQTLAQISQLFGLSRERIRQIEVKALEKLRKSGNARKIKEILG